MDTTKPKVNELCITRVFDAPRERVWKMWSDCDLLIKWWGAKDYTSPTCQMDFKEGGKYIFSMRAPESQGGGDFYSTGIYETIDPMRHIVFTDSFANEQGDIVPASFYGLEGDFPLTFTVNLRLEDEGHKTKMTLKHIGMPDGKMKELTGQGWNESFDKMDKVLAAL